MKMVLKQHEYHSQRKVITRSKLTNRVLMRSLKSEYVHGYESLLQAEWSLALDWDCNVKEFYEETKKVKVTGALKPFTYYPDFKVVLADGSIDIVEIKPYGESKKPKIMTKHDAVEEHFHEMGHRFRVLTEKDLDLNARQLSNMRRYRLFALSGETSLEELKTLAPTKTTTFGALKKKIGSDKVVMELIGRQLARVDLNEKLTDETTITAITEDKYYEFY